ncbi:MAG: hypothetical protein N2738_08780, partial [Thermodesulfovibrionales bacterium]|nr:hypothetical protein [Thermodesulfovibrionales bacterium]
MIYSFKKYFRKLSLLQKFCVSIILIFAFAGTIIGLLIISKQRKILHDEMNNNQVLILQSVARESIDALLFMDPLRLDELVKTISSMPGCSFSAIIDSNKRVVGHSNKKNLGKSIDEISANLPDNIMYPVSYTHL